MSVAARQYQELHKLFKPDEEEEPVTNKLEKPTMTDKSKPISDSRYSLSDYRNIRTKYFRFMTKYNKVLPSIN